MTDSRPRPMVRSRSLCAALLAICLLLSVGIARSWNDPGLRGDEGLMLEYPALIVHGGVPFRDFQSSYGPGTYLPLAAAYEAFGTSVTVERAVGAAYRALIILAICALLAPLGAAVMLLGGSMAVFGIVVGPGPPTAFGWYAALACALWAIWLARSALLRGSRSTLWRWSGSGLLVGAAVSIRPDLGAAAVLASLVLVAGAHRHGRWSFAGGFAVGLAPLGWNLAAAGTSAFWTYYVQARLHQQPEAGVSLLSHPAMLVMLVGTAAIVLIAAIGERRRLGASPMTRCMLALGILSILLLPQFLQREDPTHFAFVAPVTLGLLAWAMSSTRRLLAVTRISIPALAALLIGFHNFTVHGYTVRNGGRSYAVDTKRDRNQLQAVIRFVDEHTTSGERIFVGPRDLRWSLFADTSLYYLLPQFRPASFYLELGPGDNTPAFTTRISGDLERAQILVLESVTPWTNPKLYPYARAGSGVPNAVVARYFRVGFQAGPYSVFLRTSPTAHATSGRLA